MKSINELLNLVANEIAKNNEWVLQELHDRYVRPLQESEILKKNEVAKRLGVCSSTVANLIETGVLQSTADGRVTEFHLREYITRHVQYLPKPS